MLLVLTPFHLEISPIVLVGLMQIAAAFARRSPGRQPLAERHLP